MKRITYDYEHSCTINAQQLEHTKSLLHDEINRIKNAQHDHYATPYASINLVHDESLITCVNTLVQEKKALTPTMIILIGIGGSNLGTLSILTAMLRSTLRPVHQNLCDDVNLPKALRPVHQSFSDGVSFPQVLRSLGEVGLT